MKKILSTVLALTLLMALTVPALAATPFTDVPTNAWYVQDLVQVQEQGLFNGKGNNTFDPQGTLTIAEAIALTARTRATYNQEVIPQVEGAWYQSAVDYALNQGILNGLSFNSFEDKATRSEMAFLFAHALPDTEYKAINEISKLPDVDSNSKYSAEIFKLYNAGILSGSDSHGTFNPDNNISRAEVAVILNRVVNPTTRKELDLDKPVDNTQSAPITIRAGEKSVRRLAQAGDTFIKSDGTAVVLTVGSHGIVGEDQRGIAPDLGIMMNGSDYALKDGDRATSGWWGGARTGQKYIVNKYDGTGRWESDWYILVTLATMPTTPGTKDGQLSADGLFIWSSEYKDWSCAISF